MFTYLFLLTEEGINDLDWSNAIGPILDSLNMVIQPSYVVVQCGADCLATDPHRIFHLTNFYPSFNSDCDPECSLSGYLYAIKKILSWKVPTLILGGGGYNFPDTARLWTRVTALTIEEVKGRNANMLSRFREFMNNSLGSSSKTWFQLICHLDSLICRIL
ncbi:unnamed protein product [Schistosoma curassoni]|uniref:Hist_deacetyl domain-containing protein n=1 Tax=Schistosoma curassoni TaxID=6186 RepID=A0A183L689_9TREM|nr:unnamed protein product [Schistosoma curassoni]